MTIKNFLRNMLFSTLFIIGLFLLGSPQKVNGAKPIILCVDNGVCAVVDDIVLVGKAVIIPE